MKNGLDNYFKNVIRTELEKVTTVKGYSEYL